MNTLAAVGVGEGEHEGEGVDERLGGDAPVLVEVGLCIFAAHGCIDDTEGGIVIADGTGSEGQNHVAFDGNIVFVGVACDVTGIDGEKAAVKALAVVSGDVIV